MLIILFTCTSNLSRNIMVVIKLKLHSDGSCRLLTKNDSRDIEYVRFYKDGSCQLSTYTFLNR